MPEESIMWVGLRTIRHGIDSAFMWPGKKYRDFITPYREKNKSYYYHQKFKRVTPYEDCEEDDGLCLFEATEQYNRDRVVDAEILAILKARVEECCVYYGQDQMRRCKKERKDVADTETNYFAKYGDMGIHINRPEVALRRQQHRMIWERRNGKSLIDFSPLPKEETSES